ncbi:MAG TPA: metallophosphoesterase, partial [Planctomycetota bacterium]|nr:metallophosphoesterase [Planctomycetota bacterium]
GVVAVVLGAALWEAIAWIRERRGRRPTPGTARRRLRLALFAVAAGGVLCIAWGVLIEPHRLEVTRLQLESAKLPPGARAIRILQISDLHCDASPGLEEDLPALVAAEKPDLILFTGDAVNAPLGLPRFRRAMEALLLVAPVVGVKGNWDRIYFRDARFFDGPFVLSPDGCSVMVRIAGIPVRVAGVAHGNDEAADRALDEAGRAELVVLLSHAPDLAPVLDERRRRGDLLPDLYLCGHTHGGQVRLPGYGALITLSREGKRFEAGRYDLPGGVPMYVNRGIGMSGGASPRVRFLCRPEITVFEVAPARR